MAKKRQARRCRARRTDGRPCGGWAIVGGFVCMAHGGAAPRVRYAAYTRELEQRALAAFNRDYARWQRELEDFYVDQVLLTARVLDMPPLKVTSMDIVLCHHEYGVPPLDDQAPKIRRDRRFKLPAPAPRPTRSTLNGTAA